MNINLNIHPFVRNYLVTDIHVLALRVSLFQRAVK